jgi:hypothetical protein
MHSGEPHNDSAGAVDVDAKLLVEVPAVCLIPLDAAVLSVQ